MMGWHISVYRIPSDAPSPPEYGSARAERVAVWQAGASGLDWLDALVAQGDARLLGGNGYPMQYAAPARHLLPAIVAGPPSANARWMVGPHDVLLEGWIGRTLIDDAVVSQCSPDEWLVVQVWDES
jgi:hypothetical protein